METRRTKAALRQRRRPTPRPARQAVLHTVKRPTLDPRNLPPNANPPSTTFVDPLFDAVLLPTIAGDTTTGLITSWNATAPSPNDIELDVTPIWPSGRIPTATNTEP